MTTEKTFRISGYVKNLENKAVPNLRIEAWDKDCFFDDFLAEAVTDQDGLFSISIPEGRFEEFFFDKRPDLYFRVRKGSHVTDEVIAETSDSVLWNVKSGITELEQPIVVDLPVEAEPEPEPEIGHRLVGRLLNEETGGPLMGFKIHAFDLDADPLKNLGYDITNGQGLFVVRYTTPAITDESVPPERNLRFHIHDREGNEIYQTEVLIQVDQEEILEVTVPAAMLPQPVTHPLGELVTTLNLDLPETLLPFLAGQEIHTLEDIRRSGGIRQLEGLPVAPDDPAVSLLEAHAVLTVLSSDVELNAKLIEKGFSSLAKIAGTPRSEFVSTFYEDLGDFIAAQIHKKATVQSDFLKNMLAWRRAEIARGSMLHELDEPLLDIILPRCKCDECESAVSPLAYLADLLKYTTEVVSIGSGETEHPISLAYLEETFRQPFGQLTTSCDELSREVRQVRLCIEVLRHLFSQWPLTNDGDSLTGSERDYRLHAYRTILTRIGTSYDEVRLIPTLDEAGRNRLAERLGIGPEHLEDLFLVSDSLTEENIEALFGLANTNPAERNPLSDGPALNDDVGLIAQWNLDGTEWNQNTSVQGQLTVNFSATGIYRIEVYRSTDGAGEPGELVAAGERATADPITLLEQNDSGLSGLVRLNYIADQASGILLQAVPKHTSWRLAYTHDQWRRQDWPSDPYEEGNAHQLPVIDPDVIGADDLRHPTQGEPVFDCWMERRVFIDGQLEELAGMTTQVPVDELNTIEAPDMSAMLARMYLPVHYPSAENPEQSEIAWQGGDTGTSPEDFDAIGRTLSNGTKAEVEVARARTWTDLRLTVEAFQRLLELRSKDNAWLATGTSEPVSEDEWREVHSILVQAQKERFYPHWCDKEKAIETALPGLEAEREGELDYPGACLFGKKYFWISLTEPEPGDWPVALPEGRPAIDPELIDLKDLPDAGVGRPARTLWEIRRAELVDMRVALRDMRGPQERPYDHFREVLTASLGDDPDILDDLIARLQSDLASSDPEVVEKAKQTVTKRFYMSIDDFQRVAEIRARLNADPPRPPTDDEWLELYGMLTSAWKRRTKYGKTGPWVREETALHLEYWSVRKARLPRWRAPAQVRFGWQAALRNRSNAPNIDPDLIDTANLRTPFVGDKAFDLWKSRHDWVNSILDRFAQDRPDDLSSFDFDAWVMEILVTSSAELMELLEQFEAGEDTAARLEQLSLTRGAFARLMSIRELVQADISSVRDDEWDEVDSILAQVLKRREFAAWRREEQDSEMLLCARHFKLPEPPPSVFPPPEPRELPRWRANWRDRRDWQDKLKSRIDQAEVVVAGVKEAVSATEEAALPMLRDALVMASGAEGHVLSTKAEWITDHLMIDGKAGGCQKTTRIAQAIETIQTLLFSLRTGQLADIYPELSLQDDYFDEKWQWLGSYATWRAAMFVFLYPENVLLPHLKRWQTPGFRQLVKELGRNRRLTPEQACEAAQRYAQYFRDVCNLEIEASVQTRTAYHEGACRTRAYKGENDLVYVFARGRATNTVYWSYYDPDLEDENGYSQSYWEPVPGLGSEEVLNVVGAVSYTRLDGKRHVYLFARAGERTAEKLVFTTFDLERFAWSGETNELDLPDDATEFSAVTVQRHWEHTPPEVAIWVPGDAIYSRSLEVNGTDWTDRDWTIRLGRSKCRQVDHLCAMIALSQHAAFLFVSMTSAGSETSTVHYRLYGDLDDGEWRPLKGYPPNAPFPLHANAWLGGLLYPGQEHPTIVYTFWRAAPAAGSTWAGYCKAIFEPHEFSEKTTIGTFQDLENWLDAVSGLSLEQILLPSDFDGYEGMTLLAFFRLKPGSTEDPCNSRYPDWTQQMLQENHSNHRQYVLPAWFQTNLYHNEDRLWKEWRQVSRLIYRLSDRLALLDVLEGLRVLHRYNFGTPVLFDRRNTFEPATAALPITPDIERVIGHSLQEGLACATLQRHVGGGSASYRSIYQQQETIDALNEISRVPITPVTTTTLKISEQLTAASLQLHQTEIESAYTDNTGSPAKVIDYLDEISYFIPVQIALQLQRRRQFTAALDWFRSIYDYHAAAGERKTCFLRLHEGEDRLELSRPGNWLLDPLNPHAVASSRNGTYTKFTILSLIRCVLSYADSEFTQDSAESLPRARTLYMMSRDLLNVPEVNMILGRCASVIDLAGSESGEEIQHEDANYLGALWALQKRLSNLDHPNIVTDAVERFRDALGSNLPLAERFLEARSIVDETMGGQPHPADFAHVLEAASVSLEQSQSALLTQGSLVDSVIGLGHVAQRDLAAGIKHVVQTSTGQTDVSPAEMELTWLRQAGGMAPIETTRVLQSSETGIKAATMVGTGLTAYKTFATEYPLHLLKVVEKASTSLAPSVNTGFCVPPNPFARALRLHAEINLYKLRNCRNIEGLEREIPLYGAPTDVMSGMPMIGEAGQLTLPGTITSPGTPYRYDYLVERARHLADRAAQMEAAFLTALEKRDAEYYNLMKARQDVQLAKAGVRLQDLRVREAEDGVTLAELQRTRSQLQADRYSEWLQSGISDLEAVSVMLLHMAAGFHFQAAMAGFAKVSIAGALSSMAASLSTEASMLSTLADYERRRQQWELQRDLALQDVMIGGQQVRLAKDRVRIVGQERKISQMQADFAVATADFLANKFTNVELYDWMSQVLEGVYGFFLQEAAAVAKLAEQQLAFERQESPPGLIQADYWEAPSDDMIAPGPDMNAPDRRGLTGSARLLEDIHRLDQHRFETAERKLQLTKTISLTRLDPFEFQRFRENGVMNFNTQMELFDRDFPGHYLRLIKRVRISVIALIPPVTGIQATLSTTGLSRVVVGSMGLFQTVLSRRDPESVTLTSPRDATGLFELVPQSQEMMLPFESMGVDTGWELRMPKASNLFDYRTIADVLMTIEYTAINSYDYRQQVIRELDASISADRPFSFRHQFADAWYDLHNPDQTAAPMTVGFSTCRDDFPPNIEDLKVRHVLLYFARKAGAIFEIEELEFYFTEEGSDVPNGGSAATTDGLVSTRRANAGSWMSITGKQPAGEWELKLPDTPEIRRLFQEEAVEDILFVITYKGETPPWPQ